MLEDPQVKCWSLISSVKHQGGLFYSHEFSTTSDQIRVPDIICCASTNRVNSVVSSRNQISHFKMRTTFALLKLLSSWFSKTADHLKVVYIQRVLPFLRPKHA